MYFAQKDTSHTLDPGIVLVSTCIENTPAHVTKDHLDAVFDGDGTQVEKKFVHEERAFQLCVGECGRKKHRHFERRSLPFLK